MPVAPHIIKWQVVWCPPWPPPPARPPLGGEGERLRAILSGNSSYVDKPGAGGWGWGGGGGGGGRTGVHAACKKIVLHCCLKSQTLTKLLANSGFHVLPTNNSPKVRAGQIGQYSDFIYGSTDSIRLALALIHIRQGLGIRSYSGAYTLQLARHTGVTTAKSQILYI